MGVIPYTHTDSVYRVCLSLQKLQIHQVINVKEMFSAEKEKIMQPDMTWDMNLDLSVSRIYNKIKSVIECPRCYHLPCCLMIGSVLGCLQEAATSGQHENCRPVSNSAPVN